jgi:hypothetical protein
MPLDEGDDFLLRATLGTAKRIRFVHLLDQGRASRAEGERAGITDPRPTLPILEALRDDSDLYVRRSVANHLDDIAKDHPALVFELCERWLEGASSERKWLVRHAVRHPAKKGVKAALRLRQHAA